MALVVKQQVNGRQYLRQCAISKGLLLLLASCVPSSVSSIRLTSDLLLFASCVPSSVKSFKLSNIDVPGDSDSCPAGQYRVDDADDDAESTVNKGVTNTTDDGNGATNDSTTKAPKTEEENDATDNTTNTSAAQISDEKINNTCATCTAPCQTCTGSASNCTRCITDYKLVGHECKSWASSVCASSLMVIGFVVVTMYRDGLA